MTVLPTPGVRQPPETGQVPEQPTVSSRTHLSVRLVAAGLACCGLEVSAAIRRAGLAWAVSAPEQELDVDAETADPPADRDTTDRETTDLNVLVVAGTVTDVLAPAVRSAYLAMPTPRAVVSFGACSDSGGPYWDSYSVSQGIDHLVPVDVFVPGCPPSPESLLEVLADLTARPGAATCVTQQPAVGAGDPEAAQEA